MADFPAGDVEGLAKAADDDAARCQCRVARRAGMWLAVKHHMLIDLVADDDDVGAMQQLLQAQHVGIAPDRAARVVRRVDHDGACARRDGGGDAIEIGSMAVRIQADRHRYRVGHADARHIAVVAGFQHDHFIAGLGDGEQGGQQRLGGACGDGDFALGIVAVAVERLDLGGNRFTQGRNAGHGRVLVVALLHRLGHAFQQRRVTAKIRKTLAQVHRLVLQRQRRHDGKNRRAAVGQARRNAWCRVHASVPYSA